MENGRTRFEEIRDCATALSLVSIFVICILFIGFTCRALGAKRAKEQNTDINEWTYVKCADMGITDGSSVTDGKYYTIWTYEKDEKQYAIVVEDENLYWKVLAIDIKFNHENGVWAMLDMLNHKTGECNIDGVIYKYKKHYKIGGNADD